MEFSTHETEILELLSNLPPDKGEFISLRRLESAISNNEISGSTVRDILQSLHTKYMIEFENEDHVKITDAGVAALCRV